MAFLPLLMDLLQFAVLAAIIAFVARRWWRRRRLEEWPMTQGTVEEHVVSDGLDKGGPGRAVIWYSYEVEGEFYSGSYRLPESERGKNPDPKKLFARFPRGQRVPVRYDPRRPEESVLDVEEAARNAEALSG